MSNISYNSTRTRIKKLVKISNFYSGFIGRAISFFFWLLGVISLTSLVLFLIFDHYIFSLGLILIFLAIFLIFLAIRGFLRFFVKNPEILSPERIKEKIKQRQKVNFFDCLSVSAAEALLSVSTDLEETDINDLLIALLESPDSSFILDRIGVSKSDILEKLKTKIDPSSIRFSHIAERSIEIAIFEGHNKIKVGDIFLAISECNTNLSTFLSEINIEPEDIANIVYWQTVIEQKNDENKKILDPNNLHLTGGIGRDWAYGYTLDLNQFSIDLTEEVSRYGLGLELIGHERETLLLEQALGRVEGANAVLVGEPGVGKRTIVLGLAKKLNEGKSTGNISHKHIRELNVDLLISGLSGPGELTERLTRVFSQAASAGNIIIFIDGIEKLLSSGETGKIDASAVLAPYLSYPEINFIGTTNSADYNSLIPNNPAISQKMEKIEVSEPSDSEMIRIIEDLVPKVEYHFKIFVTYSAIKEVIKLANKYLLDQPNPEKSISLLNDSAGLLASSGKNILTTDFVDDFVSKKTNIPVKDASGKEAKILTGLEEELHKKVIGQNEAIVAVASALRRARAGVTDSKKPIGSFLFLGPTGVGKTETAKALALVYFSNESSMIRFDMSEYQNKEDIYRLIGSPAGYGEKIEGELISQVRNKPFSLILFDEIEKASKDVMNLFLQMLDEGYITSSAGRKVYFKNSIIIVTSNAGANLIRNLTEKNEPYEKAQAQVIDFVQNEGIFSPEFLNRFSQVVYFKPLSEIEIKQVAAILISKLAKSILETKGISLKVEFEALENLSKLGYDPQMGARPMARVISDQIENFVALKILKGETEKGSEIIFRVGDIK